MGQTAYKPNTDEILEAFSLSDKEWDQICSLPLGDLLMPHTNWPAIPKTSIRGLRFFSHHPGYPDKLPEPKSYAHTRLQIDIVKAARKLGFKAELEVCENPSNPKWIADVLVTSNTGQKIAFEVQLSSQHLDDFIQRTSSYKNSNIDVCWVLSEKPVASKLSKALCYKNVSYYKKTGCFLADDEKILTISLDIPDKNKYPNELPPIRYSRGEHIRKLSLHNAIDGIMKGFPQWETPYWKWVEK